MNAAIETAQISTGETILFALLAVSMVLVAVYGLLITRKAVYTVLSVIFVMVGFAFLYTMLDAPFMGVAQVVVYTGAILMMFLFVLMLIGVDSADSSHETLPAQKWIAGLGGLGVAAVLSAVLISQYSGAMVGLEEANALTNPVGVAKLIFSNHVLTLELTGTLLIVAALGAMTLTHRDSTEKRKTQQDKAVERIEAFVADATDPGVPANSGVFAESNSSTNPALGPYGAPIDDSVNRVLRVRGQARTVAEVSPATVARLARGEQLSGPATYGAVTNAQMPGMPGIAAPDHEAAARKYEVLEAAPSYEQLEAGEDK